MPTAYETYVQSLSPAAYWPCNEASGSVVDTVAAANLAPNAGSFTYGVTSGVPTGLARSIDVQADNASFSRFDRAAAAYSGTGNLSAMIWCKPDAGAANRFLFENGHGFASPFNGFLLRYSQATQKFAALLEGGTSTITQSDTSAAGAWRCVILTKGAANLWTLFVDNASKGTATQAMTAAGKTSLGNWDGNSAAGNSWVGELAHAAIFPFELAAGQRANLFNFGISGAPSLNVADPNTAHFLTTGAI